MKLAAVVLRAARIAPAFIALPTAILLVSHGARAQSLPQVQLQADGTVGLGDMVHLQLSATSAEAMPGDAQPGATPGFVVRGQNAAPTQTHISINGSQIDRYTLNVTWALEARRIGTFHVGPATVVVAGARYRTQPVIITVVPAGQAPRRPPPQLQLPPGFQSPFGPSPFDMWKGLVQGFDDQAPPQRPANEIDPKLSLDAPRGSVFFLHATVDKTQAVVGEQVSFSVYEYVDLSARGELDPEDAHDATAADFAKHQLLREDQAPPLVGYASVGGRTWEVKLLRRWALFPLRAGDLTIGPMRLSLLGPSGAAGKQRATETLQVRVTEPPIAKRPAGYALGDVGRFSLSAQVSPRQIEQEGAVAVHVELSGTGNVPSALAAPVRSGVEWLTPEVRDELGPTGNDAFGGKRIFDFVVRVHRAGQVDLGEIRLPFWDPDQRRYDVARAVIGNVEVLASAATASAATNDAREVLSGLPPQRDVLDGSAAPRVHPDDSAVFWAAWVASWPAALGLAVAGGALGRRAHDAWRRRRHSPAVDLRDKLAAAQLAYRTGDARGVDAAIARALEAATVAHAGVSVRGALAGEVVERLERAGVARDAAAHVATLLRECEAARFAPDASDIVSARDRWVRAKGAIRSLERAG